MVCTACRYSGISEDTNILECPAYNARLTVQRCQQCPLRELDRVRAESEAGRMLEIVLELDHATTTYRVGWDDITAAEDAYLRILRDERNKYERERSQSRTP